MLELVDGIAELLGVFVELLDGSGEDGADGLRLAVAESGVEARFGDGEGGRAIGVGNEEVGADTQGDAGTGGEIDIAGEGRSTGGGIEAPAGRNGVQRLGGEGGQ